MWPCDRGIGWDFPLLPGRPSEIASVTNANWPLFHAPGAGAF